MKQRKSLDSHPFGTESNLIQDVSFEKILKVDVEYINTEDCFIMLNNNWGWFIVHKEETASRNITCHQ